MFIIKNIHGLTVINIKIPYKIVVYILLLPVQENNNRIKLGAVFEMLNTFRYKNSIQ